MAMVTKTKLTVCCLGLYVLATACFAQPTVGYDTLIAHRGESADAPENTLPAYKMAVERGVVFECASPRTIRANARCWTVSTE